MMKILFKILFVFILGKVDLFSFFILLYILMSLVPGSRTYISNNFTREPQFTTLIIWEIYSNFQTINLQMNFQDCLHRLSIYYLDRNKTLCRTNYKSMLYYLTNRHVFHSKNNNKEQKK